MGIENRSQPAYPIILKPKEDWQPRMIWWLPQDPLGSKICQELNYVPYANDRILIQGLVSRDQAMLDIVPESVRFLPGRSFVFLYQNGPIIQNMPYDFINISGFGCGDTSPNDPGSNLRVIDYEKANKPPSPENYLTTHTNMGHASYVDQNGQIKSNNSLFAFTGAYTLDQVATKLGSNLVVLSHLLELKPAPFVVPIPICVGSYPQVVGLDGKPAYYIAFRVPNFDFRDGIIPLANFTDEEQNKLIFRLKSAVSIATAVSFLHNSLHLTHNQLVAGNFFNSFNSGVLPYLADWATSKPLWPNNEAVARTIDVADITKSIWKLILHIDPKIDKQNLARELLEKTIQAYLQDWNLTLNFPQDFGQELDHNWFAITHLVINQAFKLNKILPTSEEKTQTINEELEKTKQRLLQKLDV